MARRVRKELQTYEEFEKALREEVSVSAEFELPLTVLALTVEGGWEEGTIRRTLDTLRVADLTSLATPAELLVALPNTEIAAARVVEQRLRETVPEATLGAAVYKPGDTSASLIERARSAGIEKF